eukprot:Gb_18267 [translate_table: standard]
MMGWDEGGPIRAKMVGQTGEGVRGVNEGHALIYSPPPLPPCPHLLRRAGGGMHPWQLFARMTACNKWFGSLQNLWKNPVMSPEIYSSEINQWLCQVYVVRMEYANRELLVKRNGVEPPDCGYGGYRPWNSAGSLQTATPRN